MRYVALLRGINVGGNRRLPMADLRAMVAGAGGDGVRTYIQSGNVVLDHDADEPAARQALEGAISEGSGFSVDVVLRTAAQWAGVIEANPFPGAVDDPKTLHVVFLSEPLEAGILGAVDRDAVAPEEIAEVGRELYLHLPNGMGRAALPQAVAKLRQPPVQTTRNWNTVTRLAGMLTDDP